MLRLYIFVSFMLQLLTLLLLFAKLIVAENKCRINNNFSEVGMYNQTIREEARTCGVKLWQIAEQLGITDGNFSRKLRKELPDEEQERIISIIHRLAEEAATVES